MSPEQTNAIAARLYLAAVWQDVKAECAEIPQPEGWDTDDALAEIHEMALMAIEDKHRLDDARRLARAAEDALLDWAHGVTRAAHPEKFATIEAEVARMREIPRYREQIIETALHLAA